MTSEKELVIPTTIDDENLGNQSIVLLIEESRQMETVKTVRNFHFFFVLSTDEMLLCWPVTLGKFQSIVS